jgi:hypothetical protein
VRGFQGVLAAVLVLLSLSCARTRLDSERYVRDGVQYGVTQGPFHGRWWHHYERGCSFLDGGFYAEAETDLREAMRFRGRDQLWPRTYGLHFIPEYFPNRELGIVLFHQGHGDAAQEHLERSLEQQESARADYWLGEVLRANVERKQEDHVAPSLALDPVAGGGLCANRKLSLSGVARDDTYVGSITVNGRMIAMDTPKPEVAWDATVTLEPGENTVAVVVTDVSGKTCSENVTVTVDSEGPALSFERPVVVPGEVNGIAYDPAGVATLSVGGRDVPLRLNEDGTVGFSILIESPSSAASLRYTCVDSVGNATRGGIPLDVLTTAATPCPGHVAWASAGAPRAVPLGNGLHALLVGGQVAAIAALPTKTAPIAIRFTEFREGRKLYCEEAAVAVSIEAESPLRQVTINGYGVSLIPGRAIQTVSRRIRLDEGENVITVMAEDASGAVGSGEITVYRLPDPTGQPAARLGLAFLGTEWENRSPALEKEAFALQNGIWRELELEPQRFRLADRSIIEDVLREYELKAVLGARETREAVGSLIPAEVMVVGSLRRDQHSMEVVMETISTETSQFLGRVDAAGPVASRDDLERLAKDLALRLEQAFPRASGRVVAVRGKSKVISTLNALQGVHESMKCLYYREEELTDLETGTSLGTEKTIIGEGVLESVDDKKSTATLTEDQQGETSAIKVGDKAVTK